ncbi:hypothetical protein V2A60_000853 [Cordyceps javanica]
MSLSWQFFPNGHGQFLIASKNMCVLTEYVHLCGHKNGYTEWSPEDAAACPLMFGAARCKRPRVRHRRVYSYCTGDRAARGRVLAHCRRKAFREEGWLCHVCSILNVPEEGANCIFSFSCASCGAKDSPLSKLPRG